jgi:ABC-type amino acid transport substrate-binding protein
MDKREFLRVLGAAGMAAPAAFAANKLAETDMPNQLGGVTNLDELKKVLDRGALRAAFIVAPPEMIRDVNTGQLSGISHDLAEKLCQKIGLKVQWQEEVNFANANEGLGTRYDAICFTLYRVASRARVADYAQPVFYSGTGTYCRVGDERFSQNIAAINDSAITIATLDGDMASVFARERFPKAKTLALPQGTDISQMLMNVATGKADVTFANSIFGYNFMQNNAGKLQNIMAKKPLAVFGHSFVMPKGSALKELFDVGFSELLDGGVIDDILKKYEPFPNAYLRVAPPYATLLT